MFSAISPRDLSSRNVAPDLEVLCEMYDWVRAAFKDAGNYNLAVYAAGDAYSMTDAAALVRFGTTDPTLTIDKAGVYLLRATANLQFKGATFAANRTVTVKLRRTNNTAADLANTTMAFGTGVVTTASGTLAVVSLPQVIYTATAGDIISLFGLVSTAPSAGSLDVTEASILALKLYGQ